jgi:hypothetical protein
LSAYLNKPENMKLLDNNRTGALQTNLGMLPDYLKK